MGDEKRRFALIGAAGFVAPRHLKAIRDTGHQLVAACDPFDSVGVLDGFFPNARFFTEIERFDRFLEKRRRDEPIEYISICSPNYLHDAHVRTALRVKAHAICEKPLVINPWNLEQLRELQDEHQRQVFTVLQLRMHPKVRELKKAQEDAPKKRDVCLSYVTRRGPWYQSSWKGQADKSGGVAMNIGIHFFDLLTWLFGGKQRSFVHVDRPNRMAGFLELEQAKVRWFLSIAEEDLPDEVQAKGGHAFRSLTVDGEEIDLNQQFGDLHTEVYRDILAGGGYGIDDARTAIDLVYDIRQTRESAAKPEMAHPFVRGRS